MVEKHPIYPQRIRKVPRQFSWVDQRIVRERYIDRCCHRSAALYLFLVTVADARGMSYYGNRSICRRLAMDENNLEKARQELVRIGLPGSGRCTRYWHSIVRRVQAPVVIFNPWRRFSKRSEVCHDRLRTVCQNPTSQRTRGP